MSSRSSVVLLLVLLAGCGDPAPSDPRQAEQHGLLAHHDGTIRAKAAAALGALAPLEGPAIEALQRAIADREATVREAAARSLGQAGAASAAGSLTSAARDAEPAVRMAALAALAAVAPGDVGVQRSALADADAGVRQVAARALAAAGPAGTPALVEALRLRGQPAIQAVEALARSGDPVALAALAAAVADADRAIAAVAIVAAGDARLADAVPALAMRLGDADLRAQAASALGRIATPAAASALVDGIGSGDPNALLEPLRATGSVAAEAIARAAPEHRNPDALASIAIAVGCPAPALAALAARARDPKALAEALKGGPEAPALAEAIAASVAAGARDGGRIAALGILGRPGGAAESALVALTSPPGSTARAAVAALTEMGSPRAVEPLRARLDGVDARDLVEAIHLLARFDDPVLAARLRDWLRERAHKSLWHVANAGIPHLARLDPQGAPAVLGPWLLDNPTMPDLRLRAAQALVGVGPEGLRLVATALGERRIERDWRVRNLVPLLRGRQAAAPALVALMASAGPGSDGDDPGWWAAELLADARDPAPVLAIDRAALAPAIRARVLRALCMADRPDAVAAVAAGLGDPDPGVRRVAAELIRAHRLPATAAVRAALATESDAGVRSAMQSAVPVAGDR